MTIYRRRVSHMGLTLASTILILVTLPVAADAMTYSISVYSDAWAVEDDDAVYLYADISDDSELGGCWHSNYATAAHLISPSGRQADSSGPGMSAQVSLAVQSEEGDWGRFITGSLYCSCMYGPVGFGGSGPEITSFADNYQRVSVGSDSAVYSRCHLGGCNTMTIWRKGGYPPFLRMVIVRVRYPGAG